MILSITRPSNAAACESFFKKSKNYENHFVKAVPLVVTVLLSLNFLQETKKKQWETTAKLGLWPRAVFTHPSIESSFIWVSKYQKQSNHDRQLGKKNR